MCIIIATKIEKNNLRILRILRFINLTAQTPKENSYPLNVRTFPDNSYTMASIIFFTDIVLITPLNVQKEFVP